MTSKKRYISIIRDSVYRAKLLPYLDGKGKPVYLQIIVLKVVLVTILLESAEQGEYNGVVTPTPSSTIMLRYGRIST